LNPRLERGETGGRDLTFAVWKRGRASPPDGPVLVSVTDFEVVRPHDLPRVYAAGARLRAAWSSVPGSLGLWLWTKPFRRRSGSISIWETESDLRRFVRWPRHVEIMRRYRGAGEVTAVVWWSLRFEPSEIWAAGAARLGGGDPELSHPKPAP
jgi:hypothetical protein